MVRITKVSGITLRITSMAKSLHFYCNILGLKLLYGGEGASFSSLEVGGSFINLEVSSSVDTGWGRIIFYCEDVDEVHKHLTSKGYRAPLPRDAPWGERFFHIKDPDGHELSMAKLIRKL